MYENSDNKKSFSFDVALYDVALLCLFYCKKRSAMQERYEPTLLGL